MIWDILLIVLICFASLLVILISLILFPVITFGVSAAYRPSQKKILVVGSWLHPRVVSFSFNPLTKKISATLLGFQLFRKKAADTKKKSDAPVQTDTAGTLMPSGDKSEAEIVVSSKLPQDAEIHQSRLKQEPGDEEEVKDEEQVEEVVDVDEMKVEREAAVAEKKNKKKEKIRGKEKRSEKKGNEPKAGFFEKLKRNRYIYMIRQDKMFQKLFRWLMRVLKNLLKIIRFDHFNAAVKAGIEEPALLGKIYALYTMVRSTAIVTRGKPALSFEPVFMKNCLEGDTTFTLKTSVLMLLWPGIVALMTFPYFTVLWLFWKSRKLRKNYEL